MAQRPDVIIMHHPVTGHEITETDKKRISVLKQSGWTEGKAPTKPTQTGEK